MKTKKPKFNRDKVKKFAWLPVFITTGGHDAGRYVWLEHYYTWYHNLLGCGGARRLTQTVDDYNYVQRTMLEMRSDPDRFGDDPYRQWGDE